MLILETLGVTFFVSMTAMLLMLLWMAVNSKTYFEKTNERYDRVTMGNPLNGIFFRDLLTDAGLRWRVLIGKVQIAIWIVFAVIASIESVIGWA